MASDIIARGIAAKAAADVKKTAADLEEFKEETAEALAGKADLVDGKVPSEQLPSYVDDVVEYESAEQFPETGEQGKIYVALDTGYTYRWSGSEYIQIGGQDLSSLVSNFADEYSPSQTYAEGDYCIHEDALYVANTAIDPAEEWDDAHWDRTSVTYELLMHTSDTNNPHRVTKAQVGLGNVDDTSDLDKPISNATQAALDEKVDEDDTTDLGISDEQVEGAPFARAILIGEDSYNVPAKTSDLDNDAGFINEVDDAISDTSENPVQNKVIKAALDEKVDEDDTTSLTIDEFQVEGAPLLGSIVVDEDSYNIPRKTSELDNDAHFVEEEDTTDLEFDTEQAEGAPFVGSIAVGEDVYNIPVKTSDLDNDSGFVDHVDDEISDVSENPVQNKVIKAALDEKVDEGDTTDLEISESQVDGAPLLGSITVDDDSYNIPRKTSELDNDAGFVEEEDTTDLEFNTEIVEGAPLLRSISVGEDDYNLPSKTSDLTNDSGYVDTVDAALSDVSENPVQNKVVKAALDEKVDEGATSGMTISEQQVAGAPLMGSVTIEEDSFNVPTKTSDLQNDSDFLEGEDATELEIRRLFRTEYTITGNITNGTMSGDATIWSAETATVTIVPDEGYLLPESVTVTGATSTYNSSTGEIILSNAVNNVDITVNCPEPYIIGFRGMSQADPALIRTDLAEGATWTDTNGVIEVNGIDMNKIWGGYIGNDGEELVWDGSVKKYKLNDSVYSGNVFSKINKFYVKPTYVEVDGEQVLDGFKLAFTKEAPDSSYQDWFYGKDYIGFGCYHDIQLTSNRAMRSIQGIGGSESKSANDIIASYKLASTTNGSLHQKWFNEQAIQQVLFMAIFATKQTQDVFSSNCFRAWSDSKSSGYLDSMRSASSIATGYSTSYGAGGDGNMFLGVEDFLGVAESLLAGVQLCNKTAQVTMDYANFAYGVEYPTSSMDFTSFTNGKCIKSLQIDNSIPGLLLPKTDTGDSSDLTKYFCDVGYFFAGECKTIREGAHYYNSDSYGLFHLTTVYAPTETSSSFTGHLCRTPA